MSEQSSSSPRLAGKVAFITGAASGIGFACAKRFAFEGAKILGFDLNPCAKWSEIEALTSAQFVQGDVTSLSAQQAAVDLAVAEWGRVDVLMTAAGIADAGPVHMVTEDAWDKVLDINLKGTFLSIKAVLPQMMEQGGGSIITVASIEGLIGSEGGSSYNASKGGVVLLTKNVALDYGRKGVRCNCICPGFINTEMLRATIDHDFMADYKQAVTNESTFGRLGKPEEIAGAAFFLASEDSSFVSGQSLAVDGGYTAGHNHGLVELMGLA
ncbi:SDR family NAD(P)-dependent oxidoreductase [Oceanicoccus sp. KOV_DT_Chl]|uniref:SDR family NAD(P)-dependent oxidoreductase n=1 Tax=Oceanicoccus sp. KOV_DT_Chl TaxID=1904639 RepID=UPI000C7CA4E0|nr:SDR family NAD(P)-dependent oxidoreductase [Oceanicoccus sp. KOV_DT_Chl]